MVSNDCKEAVICTILCAIIVVAGYLVCNLLVTYSSGSNSQTLVQSIDVNEVITITNKEEVKKEEHYTTVLPSGSCLIPITNTALVTKYRVTCVLSTGKVLITEDQVLYDKVSIGNSYKVTIGNLVENDDGVMHGDIKKIEDII